MERQEGYYWVQYGSVFEIARWLDGKWWTVNCMDSMEDYDFNHINENRIKAPGELPD